tara:strand:- start:59 stop:181 length:123 start_codon:yes stop_codon:yes gene_type:complete
VINLPSKYEKNQMIVAEELEKEKKKQERKARRSKKTSKSE